MKSFAFSLLLLFLQLIQSLKFASLEIIQKPTLHQPLIFEIQLLKPLTSDYFSLVFHRVSERTEAEVVQFLFSRRNQTAQHSFYFAKAVESKNVPIETSLKFVWDLPPMECLFDVNEPCREFKILLIQHSWHHLNLKLKDSIFNSEIISVPSYGPLRFNKDPYFGIKPVDFLEKHFLPIEMENQMEIPDFVRPFLTGPESLEAAENEKAFPESEQSFKESIWIKSYFGQLTLKITSDCLYNKENLDYCKKYKIWYFKSLLNRFIYFTPTDISLSQILKNPKNVDMKNEQVSSAVQQLQNEIFGSLLTSHHYISHPFAIWYRTQYFTRQFNKNLAIAQMKNDSFYHKLKRMFNKMRGKKEKTVNYMGFENCLKPIKNKWTFTKNDPRKQYLLLRTLDAFSECSRESLEMNHEVEKETILKGKKEDKKLHTSLIEKRSDNQLMKRFLDPTLWVMFGFLFRKQIKYCFTVGLLMWTISKGGFLLQRGMDEWYYTSLPSSY